MHQFIPNFKATILKLNARRQIGLTFKEVKFPMFKGTNVFPFNEIITFLFKYYFFPEKATE